MVLYCFYSYQFKIPVKNKISFKKVYLIRNQYTKLSIRRKKPVIKVL